MILKIIEDTPYFLILGNFSATWEMELDCSKLTRLLTVPRSLRLFLEQHKMVDSWHYFNPEKKGYTCYSGQHGSYSRIGFFVVVFLLPRISVVNYFC